MNPIDLFVRGNPMIMLLITLAGAGVVYYAVRLWKETRPKYVSALVLTGALSVMIGMLGQAVGLVQILNVVERAQDVPAHLITDGITITFIPMVYGTFWFILALAVRYIKG